MELNCYGLKSHRFILTLYEGPDTPTQWKSRKSLKVSKKHISRGMGGLLPSLTHLSNTAFALLLVFGVVTTGDIVYFRILFFIFHAIKLCVHIKIRFEKRPKIFLRFHNKL